MSVATVPSDPSPTHSSFSTRVAACAFLAFIGMGLLAWGYMSASRNAPPLKWLLPGTPLFLVAGLALVKRIPLRVTIGAYIGGLLAVAVPSLAIWYELQNYNGGGANIGLGLLVLAVYVLLPIPMLLGGFIGWLVPTRSQPHSNSKESS